jgi:hypothetical protein
MRSRSWRGRWLNLCRTLPSKGLPKSRGLVERRWWVGLRTPTARYWYGRLLVDDPHPAEQARGRVMIEAAATDFRSLEMVTYANLAEQLLRQ